MIPFVQQRMRRWLAKPEPVVVDRSQDEAQRLELPPPLTPLGAVPWENEGRLGSLEWAPVQVADLPTFTLVTPCYNSVGFLEKTIRSVLLQSYPKLEWFIVDAGSEDGTVDIIRYYDNFITKWVSEKDDGQSDALNKGFAQARGDILCRLNADDLFLPNALFAVARSWIENDHADFIVADADLVDGNLRYINRQPYSDLSPASLIDYRKNYLIQPGVFFSKRAWERCGPSQPACITQWTSTFSIEWRNTTRPCAAARRSPFRCFILNARPSAAGSSASSKRRCCRRSSDAATSPSANSSKSGGSTSFLRITTTRERDGERFSLS